MDANYLALVRNQATRDSIKVTAFAGANSRAYLSAIFKAYRERRVVLTVPRSAPEAIPGVDVVSRQSFADDPGWFDEALNPVVSDEWAQVSFSSGTTGRPKAILLSQRALSDVVARINATMGVDESIREYVGVPVTFSFGFGRVRAVAAAGGRSFIPARGFNPVEIARMLQAGEINALSAVPTLWRVVLDNPEVIGAAGERVRWIEIGSQYMAGDEKAALKRLFPNARIVQHYGLTEASRTTLLDITAAEGRELESVGRAVGAVEIGVADGLIRIRGPHLADGLVTEDGVSPVTDADGWLTTADRGRLEDGLLYYEGRNDELINVGGIKIDPTRFEQRLGARLGHADAVAVGRLPDRLRGERILVALRRDAGPRRTEVATAAAALAAEKGLVGGGAIVVRTVSEIPTTATGKVRRNDLPDLAEVSYSESVATPAAAKAPATDSRAAELREIWAGALGVSTVPLDESFYDLGGDSLTALTVILRMEARGINAEIARGIFDGKTIAELAELPATGPAVAEPATDRAPAAVSHVAPTLTLSEAISAIHGARGVLALWVVAVHWLPGVIERLPGAPIWIYKAMEPLLRFGTPGFAIIFGLGVGALGIPQFLRNPQQFRAGAWLKFRLVAGGVLLMALFTGGVTWSEDRLGDPNWPSRLFYSAITFYALALLALPLILRLLTAWTHILATVVAAMAASMAIHEVLLANLAWRQPDGFLELAKILLTAKYGFFRMMVYVLAGVALGYLVRQHYDRPGIPRVLAIFGASLMGIGAVVAEKARPGAIFADVGAVLPWHLSIYTGAALLLLALFCRLNRAGGAVLPRPVSLFTPLITATGVMALPIFVGHELVIPAKVVLHNLGCPELLALAVPLATFLGGVGWGYLRLLRFFARQGGSQGSRPPVLSAPSEAPQPMLGCPGGVPAQAVG